MSSGDLKETLFQRGLVVGKFSPLHRGHEFLIQRAFKMCREVVLISYSKPEFPRCDSEKRDRWLAELFPQARRLVVSAEGFQKNFARFGSGLTMPENEAEASLHRRFTGFLCWHGLGITVDAVLTSEE